MQPIKSILPTIQVSQAPAQPEQRLQKIGSEEQLLQVAIGGQRVFNSTVEEIKQVLRYAMMKIGLRAGNWPSESETALIIQHVVFNYSSHTLDEIKIAFDMAIAGKLNADPNCFENFSCLYFSSIMNAYRLWAAEAYRQTVKPKAEQKIYTAEDLLDMKRGDTEAAYQRMLSGRQNVVPGVMKEMLVLDEFVKDENEIVDFLVSSINGGRKNLYIKDKP